MGPQYIIRNDSGEWETGSICFAAPVLLHLFYFETEDRKNVFYGEVVRAARSKIVVQDTDSGEKYIFLRQDTKGEQP